MNAELIFRVVDHGSPEYLEMVALRDDLLRRPLGLAFTPEQLGQESNQIHLACYAGDQIVGCLLLAPGGDEEITMRQVAVSEPMQGRGIGRAMVIESEHRARSLGFKQMILHARLTAISFYERLGYSVIGPEFMEVSIPHRRMEKRLD